MVLYYTLQPAVQELEQESSRPFGQNRHGPKIGGVRCALFLGGGAGLLSNTVSPARGLPPDQLASWSIQPFGQQV